MLIAYEKKLGIAHHAHTAIVDRLRNSNANANANLLFCDGTWMVPSTQMSNKLPLAFELAYGLRKVTTISAYTLISISKDNEYTFIPIILL